jgi:uncharacterized protein YqiB (DUF1249 family)
MKRVEVGDLVTCKLWLKPEMAVVVDNYTDATLVKVVLTSGHARYQYVYDLVVLSKKV